MKKNYFLMLCSLLLGVTMQAQVSYSGNGNSGFGGVIGTGNLQLSDDGTTVSFTFTTGGGSFNDKLVIYIDSETGGFTDTSSFTDTADPLRQAISGFDGTNRSTVNFPSGFTADHVIALDNGFAGLWDLVGSGSHNFVSSANLSGTGPYTFNATFTNLGSPSGNSFKFVATYLNNSGAFRSNEAVGDGISGGNPGAAAVTFSVPRSYPNNTWSGSTNNDWATATNWEGGVPESSHSVIIPSGLTNYPTASGAVTISSGVIQSGASLIAQDDFTGTITYNRTLGTTNWYLVSSPVSGVTFNDAFVTANNIASGSVSSSNRGIGTYTTSSDSWSYLQSGGTVNSNSGTGYSIKQSTAGNVAFTGTINTSNSGVNFVLVTSGNRFNLLGNPYTAHVASATFLNNESAISETQNIWVWNQGLGVNGEYEVKDATDAFVLAPTQAFFVRANVAGGTFNFSEANQSATGGTFQKQSPLTSIKLWINDGISKNYMRLRYMDSASNGFDIGKDGEVFSGLSSQFSVYSGLVSDNDGKKYQLQSLPNQDFETMVIPVGIIAASGKEITFTAEAMNLPEGLKVFLEDRENNTFNELTTTSNYKVTLNTAVNGSGRFFLHTRSSALSTDDISLTGVGIYAVNKNTLRISGVNSSDASVKVYNILGRKVVDQNFSSKSVYDVSLPNLNTGVYIVQLSTEKGKISKKIVLE